MQYNNDTYLSIMNAPNKDTAAYLTERWFRRLNSWLDLSECLKPCEIVELMPDGAAPTDRLPNPGTQTREAIESHVTQILFNHWYRRLRYRLCIMAYRSTCKHLHQQLTDAGIDISKPHAALMLRNYFARLCPDAIEAEINEVWTPGQPPERKPK